MRSASRPYITWRVFGFQPSRPRCSLTKAMALCSPSPGTLASDRITWAGEGGGDGEGGAGGEGSGKVGVWFLYRQNSPCSLPSDVRQNHLEGGGVAGEEGGARGAGGKGLRMQRCRASFPTLCALLLLKEM
jgi:hypothetical protein